MNVLKSFFGFVIAIGFVILGIYLVDKGGKWTVIIGYANIVFFGLVCIACLLGMVKRYKTLKK